MTARVPPCTPADSSRLAFARLLQKVNKQAEAEAEAKKAEAYFRDSLNTYPEYAASYHYLIGSSLEIQNRRAEAEAQYREALRLTPDNLEYIEGLQRVLKLQGKIQ